MSDVLASDPVPPWLTRTIPIAALVAMGACRPQVAPPSIPPPAAAAPMPSADEGTDDFGDFDDFDVPSSVGAKGTEGQCEPAPKEGIAEPDFTWVGQHIETVMQWSGAPSVAVAVARDGKILWEEGFGYADVKRRRKADEHTMYSLASVSKPFTATGIMVLRQRGMLELDQPLNELLPAPGIRAGVGDPTAATVERVASHTAGLPLHFQFYYSKSGHSLPPLEQSRRNYAVLISRPGETYRYSNLGFGLLDQAIAHLSGTTYAEFMRTEVFEPLDLQHTFVGRPPKSAGVEAVRYDGRGEPIPRYEFDHDGASALYSSAHDLVRFGMFHIGTPTPEQKEILDTDARALMRLPVAPTDRYGLGWGIARADGLERVSHNGGMPGVRTVLRTFPEQGVVTVVLVNGDTIGGDHMQIAELIEDAIGLPARADAVCALPSGHPLVRTWVGKVETLKGPADLRLEVRATGEVFAKVGDQPVRRVRNVGFADGVLGGVVLADLGAELGEEGRPTIVRLELRLRGDVLDGGLSALVPWTAATTHFAVLQPAP